MKKIIALIALCLAVITTQAALPAPIQEFVSSYNTEFAGKTEDGVKFGKAITEGKNVIIPMHMDDSELTEMGYGLKDAIDMMGGEGVMEQVMLEAIFEDSDSDDLKMFKQHQYNIVIRMIGTSSKDVVNLTIHWQDL